MVHEPCFITNKLTNIIMTDGIAFSPALVWKKSRLQGVVSNLQSFYIDKCGYIHFQIFQNSVPATWGIYWTVWDPFDSLFTWHGTRFPDGAETMFLN